MNSNSLSFVHKTMAVIPEGIRMPGKLLLRELTRVGIEWMAAINSWTARERVRIKSLRLKYQENERHCSTVGRHLVSSIFQSI